MKKYKIIFILFFAIILMGCERKTYSFKEPIDNIEKIEIVTAENSTVFEVDKTLTETEKTEFIERFQKIEFENYFLGDPMSVSGRAIKITFDNGSYEMICHYWSEYVKDGEIYYVKKSCDENEFNKLIDHFLEDSEAR